MTNLVLTGFMGTGKTTVARILAAELDRDLIDTDQLIESRHGPIPQIFAEQGEAAFRSLERDIADELAQREGLVISTGGRLLIDPVNAERLESTGVVVCLTATPETIVTRVLSDGHVRPLLDVDDPPGRIAELLAERAEGYGRFPAVATDDLTPAAVAERVLALVSDRLPR